MVIGKSYWSLSIRDIKLSETMPKAEYRARQKELRTEAAKILGNKFEYATETEALAAKKKLPKHIQPWAQVCEAFPVSLGLGWI